MTMKPWIGIGIGAGAAPMPMPVPVPVAMPTPLQSLRHETVTSRRSTKVIPHG